MPSSDTQAVRQPRLVAAIPAWNQELAVASVVVRARQFADVVVVNDGSTDQTAHVARLAGARVISHPKNGGYGAALKTMFETAKKENWPAMIVLDSDGQHLPEDIPKIAEPVLAGRADLCIGSRFLNASGQEAVPGYRKVGIKVLTGLGNVGSGEATRVSDGQSGFRCYSRAAIQAITPRDTDMGISAEILFQARKAKLRFAEVPITVRYDIPGTSTKNPVTHGVGVVGSMVRYVEREHPVAFFALPGLLSLIAGVVLGGLAMNIYFQSGSLPFGPTVGSAVFTFGGLLLAFTGLVLHAISLTSPREK